MRFFFFLSFVKILTDFLEIPDFLRFFRLGKLLENFFEAVFFFATNTHFLFAAKRTKETRRRWCCGLVTGSDWTNEPQNSNKKKSIIFFSRPLDSLPRLPFFFCQQNKKKKIPAIFFSPPKIFPIFFALVFSSSAGARTLLGTWEEEIFFLSIFAVQKSEKLWRFFFLLFILQDVGKC